MKFELTSPPLDLAWITIGLIKILSLVDTILIARTERAQMLNSDDARIMSNSFRVWLDSALLTQTE